MKVTKLLAFATAVLALNVTQAQNVTNYDSIVSLAINLTKNYTFTDTTSGQSVVVAVTMTPYSSSNASPVFSPLDNSGTGYTRLSINSGLNGGDGNWIDYFEAVNFKASLVSASAKVITNSIQFSLGGVGVRPTGGITMGWTSSATARSFSAGSEQFFALDTASVVLAGTNYTGHLQANNIHNSGPQYQLSDNVSPAGVMFNVKFLEGTGAPIVTTTPSNNVICVGDDALFVAAAVGDPNPTVQWQVESNGGSSFANISGATNITLLLTPTLSDNGNQYRAVFTNPIGTSNSTPATLTVNGYPSAVILLTSTNVLPTSTNTASAPAGAATYSWDISNGSIIGSANSQTVTYTAGTFGNMTLSLTVGNASGCSLSTSTNLSIAITSASAPGTGIYVTDYADVVEKFDPTGNGSVFAYTGETPTGLAFDRSGNLYVAETSSGSILKFATNGTGSVFATGMSFPFCMAFDGAGNLYVTDLSAKTIWKVLPNGALTVFTTSLNSPYSLAFDAPTNLYVVNGSDSSIWKFTPAGVGSLFTTNVNATALTFDSSGNLYVSDMGDSLIWKVDSNRAISLVASNNLNYPNGMAFDQAGNLYAANNADGTVTQITPTGNSTIFSAPNLYGGLFVAAWPLPSQLIPGTKTMAVTNSTVSLAVSNSLIDLATNITLDYTFTDPNNGLAVIVAVTMTPYSSSNASPAFTLLDFYGTNDSPVHLGIDSGLGGGDGNWIDPFEGVNFSASLVSASSGIATNSIRFGISWIGIRPNGGSLSWSSSVQTNLLTVNDQSLFTLDTNTLVLTRSAYSGQLRGVGDGGQYQLSDSVAPAGGLVLDVTFIEGTVTNAGPATLSVSVLKNNQFQLSVTGTSGANYIVQSATNLVSPTWVSLTTNNPPFTFAASNTAACSQQFFRVVAQ